jgi:hypothetical protein
MPSSASDALRPREERTSAMVTPELSANSVVCLDLNRTENSRTNIEGYVKGIEILLGCLKVELSVLRGQQIIAEDERRGGNRNRK